MRFFSGHSSSPNGRTPRRLHVDPRTKILLTCTVGCSCLMLLGGYGPTGSTIRIVLAAAPAILLALTSHWRISAAYCMGYAGCLALSALILPHLDGILGWIWFASAGIITQMLPGLMSAYWICSTTTLSEFIAAMQRMRLSSILIVAFAVMIRFFPTVVAEQHAIHDAMTMRGVRWGGGKASRMLDYRIMPLATNTIRMADTTAQAALTRGLGASNTRTSIARIGFGPYDAAIILFCCGCALSWLAVAWGVLP